MTNSSEAASRETPLSVPEPVTAPPPNAPLLVISNAPDASVAQAIATALVDEGLAACVNLLAPCTSVYRWNGAVETAVEVPLLIKTSQDRYARLQARLLELHPYELPEILAFRPDGGLPAYAQWILRETRVRPRLGNPPAA